MNKEETRKISQETINNVISKLNQSFIDDLPCSPYELAKYAERRTNPFIADSINYNLGKKMLETRLSDEEYLKTFFKIIYDVFAQKKVVKQYKKPIASILVSQTGAGKSNLREMILKENPNTVIINSDLYKKFRPDISKIMEEDSVHFSALTGIDCYDHAKNIVQFAVDKGYNILMEEAPSIKQGLINVNMDKLNEFGYDVTFHILAVGNLISALAIHSRYEQDLRRKLELGSAKLTDLNRHDDSYKAVELIIKNINPKIIKLYKRGSSRVSYPEEITPKNVSTANLIETLNRERQNSNDSYVFGNTGEGFISDYLKIKNAMEHRNAPSEEKNN